MANGRWGRDNGKWRTANGRWIMANGKWRIGKVLDYNPPPICPLPFYILPKKAGGENTPSICHLTSSLLPKKEVQFGKIYMYITRESLKLRTEKRSITATRMKHTSRVGNSGKKK